MTTEDIEIAVTFTGADSAVSGAERVASGVESMGDAAAESGRQQQLAATQAIAFGQRLQGVAMAVQSLTSQLGDQSRTAGLIGATIASSVQFAQLGMALGPGGAIVGAITGALIPALRELILAQDDAAVSARELQHEEELLTERGQRLAEERRRQVDSEVESGRILTLSEEEITRATALAAERRRGIYEQLQVVAHALRRAEEQGMDATSGRFREWTTQAETLRAELVAVTTQINNLDAATLNRGRRASTEANEANQPPTRRGSGASGSGGRGGLGQQEQFRPGLNSSDEVDATAQLLARQQEITEDLRARREATDQLADAEQLRAEQYAANAQAEADWSQQLFEQQKAQDAERIQHEQDIADQVLQKQQEHNARVNEEASAIASSLISSMTDVLTQMVEGSATAEEGAQMMLAAFLQAISQRAQIEALAEVASAIGAAASYNFVGAAGHAAAALAWGAVAVATGIGGAAISSGVSKAQAARAEAEKPASPRSSGVTEGKGGGTTIINWNSPVVTAQTTADLGRTMRQMIGVSARRFPGGS